jgi:hypothetical protein
MPPVFGSSRPASNTGASYATNAPELRHDRTFTPRARMHKNTGWRPGVRAVTGSAKRPTTRKGRDNRARSRLICTVAAFAARSSGGAQNEHFVAPPARVRARVRWPAGRLPFMPLWVRVPGYGRSCRQACSVRGSSPRGAYGQGPGRWPGTELVRCLRFPGPRILNDRQPGNRRHLTVARRPGRWPAAGRADPWPASGPAADGCGSSGAMRS